MMTQKQQKFLKAMMEEQSIAEASKSAGISQTTAYKYLDDGVFKKELQRARRKAVDGISHRLRRLGNDAIDTLRDNLTDAEATPATKNSTAKIILEFIYRSHELENVTERLDELESKIDSYQKENDRHAI
jgi:molybdenum-dependent DNA-binding transcriptional regulator ModE